MQFARFILFIFALFASSNALADQGDGKGTTTQTATTIWVTVTSKGTVMTIPTTYVQSFMTLSENTDDFESGDIGLGSSREGESVGQIRTYTKTTVSNSNHGQSSNEIKMYSGLLGLAVLAVGIL